MITLPPLNKGLFFLPTAVLASRQISVKLFWEGVWEIEENKISENSMDIEGVFMILTGKRTADNKGFDPDSYSIVYIGESKNIFESLKNHKQWATWKKYAGTDPLLIKIAKTDKSMNRKKIASSLVSHTYPACNKGLILPPLINTAVEIQNLGYKNPLSKAYHPFS